MKPNSKTKLDDINNLIEAWHNSDSNEPLYVFLGWTEEEYKLWLEDENVLPKGFEMSAE